MGLCVLILSTVCWILPTVLVACSDYSKVYELIIHRHTRLQKDNKFGLFNGHFLHNEHVCFVSFYSYGSIDELYLLEDSKKIYRCNWNWTCSLSKTYLKFLL